MIYSLNYIPYSKKSAMETLEGELGWRYYGGKHYESEFTGFAQSYIQPVKFNLDYRKATLSTQICTGEVTREEALEILKTPPYDPKRIEQKKEYVCKKLEITLEEFENIMNMPPKSYKDYPNDEKMLNFIYNIYKKLYNKK